jgi:hypothetical protein
VTFARHPLERFDPIDPLFTSGLTEESISALLEGHDPHRLVQYPGFRRWCATAMTSMKLVRSR